MREAAGIVRLLRNGSPGVSVRELLERTDGWAAGLVLLLQQPDRRAPGARRIGEQVPAEMVDYFGNEILRRLDDETKSFLMRSAFLPRMTSAMAERLSGAAHAGRILSDLNRQNLFTEKSSRQEPVYEYHALFREFLLEQATCAFSGDALGELRRGAAAVLEEAGFVEDAVPLLRQARDWDALARLVVSRASALCAQGRHRTVLDWVAALPADVRDGDPWLTYWQEWLGPTVQSPLGLNVVDYRDSDAGPVVETIQCAMSEARNGYTVLSVDPESILGPFATKPTMTLEGGTLDGQVHCTADFAAQ